MATRRKASVRRAAPSKRTPASKLPLSPDLPRQMYQQMLKCRMVEERLHLLANHGKLTVPYCAAVGREAIEVGATIDIESEDMIAPSDRDFIAAIMKREPLQEVFRKRNPRSAEAPRADAAQNTSSSTSGIAAQLNIGTGAALAYKTLEKQAIVVSISGASSTPVCALHDALSFAGSHKLPIVYVIENCAWDGADHPGDLSATAQAYGLPCITVDGNDVVAVYRVSSEARDRARQGYGPTLVECVTNRSSVHAKTAEAAPCPEHLEECKSGDPISSMEQYLRKKGLWDETWKRRIVNEIKREIQEAASAKKSSAR